jgi:D-methionine transport system permease protein
MSDMWLQLLLATGETLYMVLLSSFVAVLIGLPMGCFLFLTRKHQLLEHKAVNTVLGFVVNVGRSIPYVILMIAVIPLTRLMVGTSIGTSAAIVPLSLAAIPFFARLVEAALLEVGEGLVEAGLAMGASNLQVVVKVLLPEAMGALISGVTITVIALIGYSAMAGVVGGGGLGDLAIRYGYQRFDTTVMIETIVILVVMVQIVQWIGDGLAKRCQ